MALTSYAQVKAHLNTILTNNGQLADTQNASPHGAWWDAMTYDEFIGGNVPGVTDPVSKKPMPILVRGSSSSSNLILALQGATGTAFDRNTGKIGQMPADGPPFFTPEQIQLLAGWIDAGCPNNS